MRIDAHQHYWLYNAQRDTWITEDMEIIRRNFLPTDISTTLKEKGIDGVVAVQADQSAAETQFLLDLSTMYALIKGIVGWVDLQAPDIENQLQAYKAYPRLKGFRHIVEGEEDPYFLMRPDFLKGISALTKHGYTYDLLIHPRHYASTLACVAANPEQRFMLDHMAKPAIKEGKWKEWADFIEELAEFPNVFCKVSGLATEADWKGWKSTDFTPYVAHAIQCFGKGRILFGSDWPVCILAANYEESLSLVQAQLADFSANELAAFWGGNTTRFYNL